MQGFYDDDYCFVCGKNNPIGLKLNFNFDTSRDEISSETRFTKTFQGWKDILHGGIISAVLDEIMIKAANIKNIKCVTAELNVRFKKPAQLNTDFIIRGKINEIRNKIVIAEGSIIEKEKGTTLASATGKYFIL